jgi:hypothetical protein
MTDAIEWMGMTLYVYTKEINHWDRKEVIDDPITEMKNLSRYRWFNFDQNDHKSCHVLIMTSIMYPKNVIKDGLGITAFYEIYVIKKDGIDEIREADNLYKFLQQEMSEYVLEKGIKEFVNSQATIPLVNHLEEFL